MTECYRNTVELYLVWCCKELMYGSLSKFWWSAISFYWNRWYWNVGFSLCLS